MGEQEVLDFIHAASERSGRMMVFIGSGIAAAGAFTIGAEARRSCASAVKTR